MSQFFLFLHDLFVLLIFNLSLFSCSCFSMCHCFFFCWSNICLSCCENIIQCYWCFIYQLNSILQLRLVLNFFHIKPNLVGGLMSDFYFCLSDDLTILEILVWLKYFDWTNWLNRLINCTATDQTGRSLVTHNRLKKRNDESRYIWFLLFSVVHLDTDVFRFGVIAE